FLTAYFSVQEGERTITGTPRMQQRPIRLLVDALRSLGANIEYLNNEGFPPLKINGQKLTGGTLTLEGNVSSQYISALLMIAPYMEKGLSLTLSGEIISKPYIEMTIQLMREYGVSTDWDENIIRIAPQRYTPTAFHVESDWSAASYWYEIASLIPNSVFELSGLKNPSTQGDARIAEFFKPLGVETQYTETGIRLTHTDIRKNEINLDLTNQPDLAQTLVVTCALLNIPFRFTGLQSLKIKETDRITALKTELSKLGYVITDKNNSVLEWGGQRKSPETAPDIDTYDDHRMAMAFAPAAMLFPGLIINHPEVVSKSYPDFWNDLRQCGFSINEV
ncbi:MAG: 3-phosphoshikimate 1-carboxyvinyltransferase, partial [Bacteroidaceae bacterium]|nr:3-phosphoshikimate 1-carboxyvinyltransferase [Bacteroidaceae bacterium]